MSAGRYKIFLPLLSSVVLRNYALFWISMHINVVESWLRLHHRVIKRNAEFIGNVEATPARTVAKACLWINYLLSRL